MPGLLRVYFCLFSAELPRGPPVTVQMDSDRVEE